MSPQFLEHIVILCFERRFFKENSVIRLKSNILSPQNFWLLPNSSAGYAIVSVVHFREDVLQFKIKFLCPKYTISNCSLSSLLISL